MSQPREDELPELPELPLPPPSSTSNSQPPEDQHPTEHPESAPSAAGPSSSRPSSAGSSGKRPAPEDEISELVRKAKASRYAQPVRKSSDDDFADMLEQDLSCAICSEVLVNPVACCGCFHRFCGSCLVLWFERRNTCPTCRRVIKKIGDDHSTAQLIEDLLSRFPEKRRDPEELKELEKVYRPGQAVHIEESDPGDEDEDGNHTDEDEDPQIEWPPCPCCAPNNPHGFQCPEPIPATDPPYRADVYIYRNHVTCPNCPNTIPTDWKPSWRCLTCGTVSCSALFNCASPGILGLPETHITNFSIAPHMIFHGNQVEMRRFEDWRASTNTTYPEVSRHIYNWLLGRNGGQFPILGRMVAPDAYVCGNCTRSALVDNAMAWWIGEKPLADNRQKCWYGWGCRTQFHNQSHAERLQHCCPETPVAERGQGGRGGRGNGGAGSDAAGAAGPAADIARGQHEANAGLPEQQ